MGSLNRYVVDNGVLVDPQHGVQHEWAIGGIVHGTFAGQGAHALGQQETGTERLAGLAPEGEVLAPS